MFFENFVHLATLFGIKKGDRRGRKWQIMRHEVTTFGHCEEFYIELKSHLRYLFMASFLPRTEGHFDHIVAVMHKYLVEPK